MQGGGKCLQAMEKAEKIYFFIGKSYEQTGAGYLLISFSYEQTGGDYFGTGKDCLETAAAYKQKGPFRFLRRGLDDGISQDLFLFQRLEAALEELPALVHVLLRGFHQRVALSRVCHFQHPVAVLVQGVVRELDGRLFGVNDQRVFAFIFEQWIVAVKRPMPAGDCLFLLL
jgi:hypothetical protein